MQAVDVYAFAAGDGIDGRLQGDSLVPLVLNDAQEPQVDLSIGQRVRVLDPRNPDQLFEFVPSSERRLSSSASIAASASRS